MMMKPSTLFALAWLVPAALAWTAPPTQILQSTSQQLSPVVCVAASHKDTLDEINKEIRDLGQGIKDQFMSGPPKDHPSVQDDLHIKDLQKQLEDTQARLVSTQATLEKEREHLDEFRVVFITTERELLREIAARNADKNSYKKLLKSAIQLTTKRIKNAYKALTNKRWRRVARSVRAEQKKTKE